jgi:hypothetical protein
MDSRPAVELLAHFDSPFGGDGDDVHRIAPSRGILWVLKWPGAIVVLTYGACNLLQASYCLAAERALLQAVKAGALEATLPGSTRSTVAETVQRYLSQQSIATTYAMITIRQNDLLIGRAVHFAEDSVVSVSIAVPAADVLPAWLRTITAHGDDSTLRASAERRIPGKHLPVATSRF